MTTFSKEDIKKYALNYLNRYASSKKNLKFILLRKIKKLNVKERDYEAYIKDILRELEDKNIISDENLANSIAYNYARNGKSIKLIKYHLMKKGINSKDINESLWFLIYLDEQIPQKIDNNIIIFGKENSKKKYNFFYLFKVFLNVIFQHKGSLVKTFHFCLTHLLFY